jgi:hypothetical protein
MAKKTKEQLKTASNSIYTTNGQGAIAAASIRPFNEDLIDSMVFNVEIRTQDDFEDLIHSANWFGAESVAFYGDGGTLKFILDSSATGIIIPSNVKVIKGFNGATIELTNFQANNKSMGDMRAGLYSLTQRDDDFSIDGMMVRCIARPGWMDGGTPHYYAAIAFRNLSNMSNCYGYAQNSGVDGNSIDVLTYVSCNNLYNCKGYSITDYGYSHTYHECTNLYHCQSNKPNIIGGENGAFYSDCVNLINCSCSCDQSYNSYYNAFEGCDNLTNCKMIFNPSSAKGRILCFYNCTRLANCSFDSTIVKNSLVSSYVFYNCSYCSNCTYINTSGGMLGWGGSNIKIDDSSCDF